MSTPIWTPSPERIAAANMTDYIRFVARTRDASVTDYDSAYAFSVERIGDFWDSVWDFLGIVGDKGGRAVERPDALPGARWFPEARLNFAENHLRRRDDGIAIIAYAESGAGRVLTSRVLTWRELYDAV